MFSKYHLLTNLRSSCKRDSHKFSQLSVSQFNFKKIIEHLLKCAKVVYKVGVLGHFAPWDIFGLLGNRTFWLKTSDKKNCQNS